MNDGEKKLWDDIVRTQTAHSQLGEVNVCVLANKVIEARRVFFALPVYCCSDCNEKNARITDLEQKLREAHSLIGGERLDVLRAVPTLEQVAVIVGENGGESLSSAETERIARAVVASLTGPKKPTKPAEVVEEPATEDAHRQCLDCRGTGWSGGNVRNGACDIPRHQ